MRLDRAITFFEEHYDLINAFIEKKVIEGVLSPENKERWEDVKLHMFGSKEGCMGKIY